jgi:hypothetical protein
MSMSESTYSTTTNITSEVSMSTSTANVVYAGGGSIAQGFPPGTLSNSASVPVKGNLIATGPTLQGDNADIVLNGLSLTTTLSRLEQRLNLLSPNPKLEAEWHELRELGERYRQLEAEFEEKSRMWQALKKTE